MDAGWDLRQSLERLFPRRVIEDTQRKWRQGLSELVTADGDLLKTLQGEDIDSRIGQYKIFRNLFEGLRNGRLVAFGYFKNVQAPLEYIQPTKWIILNRLCLDGSRAESWEGGGYGSYCSVSIYPTLRSPNASEIIAGQLLGNVIRQFALCDPEIEVACFDGSEPHTFRLIDHVNKCGSGAVLVRPVDDEGSIAESLSGLPSDSPGAAGALERALPILFNRIAALSSLLVHGRLIATAIAEGDHSETRLRIPPAEFERPSLRLCLATGDIWQEADGSARRIFHALRLAKPIDVHALPESSAETVSARPGGRKSQYNWEKAVNHAFARLMMEHQSEAERITSAADLYRAIRLSFEELAERDELGSRRAIPRDEDAIKSHMEKYNRPLLDEIQGRKNCTGTAPG